MNAESASHRRSIQRGPLVLLFTTQYDIKHLHIAYKNASLTYHATLITVLYDVHSYYLTNVADTHYALTPPVVIVRRQWDISGLILGSANKRRRYSVTKFIISFAQA